MWSWIKKKVKAAVRVVMKGITGFVMRTIYIIGEIVTLGLPPKHLRIQVFILRDVVGNALASEADLGNALGTARKIFKSEFNVTIKFYGEPGVQILPGPAPQTALDVRCDWGAYKDEFGDAGEYFAQHLAGWNAVPISLSFPITVFVVRHIVDKIGCSIPITDYVTLSTTPAITGGTVTGISSATTLAHELAHSCLLMHRNDQNNLLFAGSSRGTATTWWQRRVLRTSRHCAFW